MASIERRELQRQDSSGRVRRWSGTRSGTATGRQGAQRDQAPPGRCGAAQGRDRAGAGRGRGTIHGEARSGWRSGRPSGCSLGMTSLTTAARLATTLGSQVLPRFGSTPLVKITQRRGPSWVADMLASGLSRRRRFARRSSPCDSASAAAIADHRLASIPRPTCRCRPSGRSRLASCRSPRSSGWWRRCLTSIALVLVGAFGGLRWGEAAGLTRATSMRCGRGCR